MKHTLIALAIVLFSPPLIAQRPIDEVIDAHTTIDQAISTRPDVNTVVDRATSRRNKKHLTLVISTDGHQVNPEDSTMNYDDKQYMYHWINRKNSVRVPLDDNPRAFFEVYIEMDNIERAEFLRKLGAFVEEYINSRSTPE